MQASDPLYPQQYYLNQSNGVDINAPELWSAQTSSSAIKVAVIDDGVEDHPEFNYPNGTSRVINGYTPLTGGNGRPTVSTDAHGVACAGIVTASHNTIGVRGVAPNVQVVPVDIFVGGEQSVHLAAAIDWAWQNGADVLSNSWGYDLTSPTAFPNIVDAINRARTQGRGGKGSIVIFAAGNNGGDVQFPASASGSIAVGAIDRNGALWYYSARGPKIELVAPSGDISLRGDVATTDRVGANGYESGEYTSRFGGTSAACPQVSGCAAAILSANPNLTESQVRSIMNSTATSLNISGTGNGRLNTYAAVKRTLELYGGTISGVGNLPFSETWNMQPNVSITVAQGTSINTTGLIFQRATGSNWGGIYINSNNSTFNSCQFLNGSGGGNYMVFVRGYDVFFNNCTFSGATDAGTGRGISTDLTPSGQRSRLHLTNCVFQNNRTGVVLYNCDAFLNNCTIQNNTSVGLYQLNATNVMWSSEIMNNVTNIGSEGERAGIENLGSTLSMASYSYNTVKDNLSHEILNDNGSFLYAGTPSPSYNSIYDSRVDYATMGRKYIINYNSSFTVQARTNYWGGDPVPEMFSGAVDYSNWLTYNPTGFSAPPDNLVVQANGNVRAVIENQAFNPVADEKDADTDARRTRIVALLAELQRSPDDPQNYRLIAELHGLSLLDREDKTRQRATVFQALSDWENRAVSFRQANANAALRQTHPTQRAGEQAALATLNLLIKQDRYDEARQRLSQAKSIIERKESQLALLMSEATLEEQAGRFQSALDRIQSVRRLAAELFGSEANRYEIAEQNLRQKLGDSAIERETPTVATNASVTSNAAPIELLQNYPNPFNPSTVISYQLPVASQVNLKVYDMLGREVQTLVNQAQAAGRYTVQFNASGLASGTYFYKLQAGGFVQTKKLTLVK